MIRRLTLLTFMACSLAGHAQQLTIAMTGDVMMGTTFPSIMLPANDGRYLFRDTKKILSAADLAVGNLEGAIRTPTSYGHLL